MTELSVTAVGFDCDVVLAELSAIDVGALVALVTAGVIGDSPVSETESSSLSSLRLIPYRVKSDWDKAPLMRKGEL